MKKATFIKLLCLVIACLMLLPMVIACGEDANSKDDDGTEGTTGSTQGGTTSTTGSNAGGNTGASGETVTVAFLVNGGQIVSGEASVKVSKGGKLTTVPVVARQGHKFEGWSYTAGGNDPWQADDTFSADVQLYATWSEVTAGKVGITFVVGEGAEIVADYIEIEAGAKLAYSDIPAATKSGYTLKGWAFDLYGNEMWSARNDVFDSNATLYAIWEKEASSGGSTTTGKVGIFFDGNGGSVVFDYVEIDKGAKLAYSSIPSATRAGYTLKGWAFDPYGNDVWSARNDTFDSDTELFAIWEKEGGGSQGGTTDTETPGGNDPVVPSGKITIEFNTGTGYFEDANNYEMEIDKGGRIPAFPTKPVHEKESMVFEGWYVDEKCTISASLSKKYEEDTVLYAKWTEMVECSDGSYDHVWGSWDMDSKPTCDAAGKDARFCTICGNKQLKDGDEALGHLWNAWEEAFMRRERACGRLGCTEKEIINYSDVTISVLGSNPGEQVEGSTDKFYGVPFTNLINGRWDESWGEFVGPNGTGAAHVQFNLIEATSLDRIYFKGNGVTSINVFVQYEGESDFTLIGVCSSSPDKESTPFVSPDASKKIVAIKFQEDNPPQGTSMWQEVAFVKVAAEE